MKKQFTEEQIIGISRYQAKRPEDGELRERLHELAARKRRYGYRRLHVLLRRELIEEWRLEYNSQRPHSSIGYLALISLQTTFLTADSMAVSD